MRRGKRGISVQGRNKEEGGFGRFCGSSTLALKHRAERAKSLALGEGFDLSARSFERRVNSVRRGTDSVNTVASLGHIGDQPAVNIPIDETGEFLQKSHTQAGFELSAEAQQPHSEGKCEEEKYDEEEENGIDSGPSLFR